MHASHATHHPSPHPGPRAARRSAGRARLCRSQRRCVGLGYRGVVRAEPSSPEAADDDVAARWVAGDESALRLAYEQFGSLIYTFCSRALADQGAASDCTQETFLSAWRSRQSYDPARGSLAGWLIGIARFKVRDAYRAAPRVPI